MTLEHFHKTGYNLNRIYALYTWTDYIDSDVKILQNLGYNDIMEDKEIDYKFRNHSSGIISVFTFFLSTKKLMDYLPDRAESLFALDLIGATVNPQKTFADRMNTYNVRYYWRKLDSQNVIDYYKHPQDCEYGIWFDNRKEFLKYAELIRYEKDLI